MPSNHASTKKGQFQVITRRIAVRGVLQKVQSACSGFTFCSTGSTCRALGWRKRYTIPGRCGNSWVSTCDGEPALDETTICKFRHLLEANGLGESIFHKVGEHLKSQWLRVSGGTIVDAIIINAPSSTKNQGKRRDPEMHQTRKGNQWYFGMKAHIGVDADSK